MVKKAKVVPRWQPLPEDASTMQVIVIPEVDEHRFNPDEMSKEELKNLSIFLDQSNRTLEVENLVIERYLMRMDAHALSKMDQILEAAEIAMQKAERAAQLGGGPSTVSIVRDLGSRITDDSSGDTSRSDTVKSVSSRAPKLGIFGLSDKGPKVQFAQKIEIVNREIDELKNVLENFREKCRKSNYLFRCRNEEISARLQEVIDSQSHFEQKLLIEGLDPMTGKLPGEKFIRYLEMRLKSEEMEIDKIRIKTGSLRSQLKKVMQQLTRKEELEVLHSVDFEQLEIENRECQEILEEKVAHVNRVKRINGNYGTILNSQKKKLKEQVNVLAELEQISVVKNKLVQKFMADEGKITSEVNVVVRCMDKTTRLMKSFTVPDVIDYIKKKAEVHDLQKEIKILNRKIKIEELVLAGQAQKLKSLSNVSSKNLVNQSIPSMSKDTEE